LQNNPYNYSYTDNSISSGELLSFLNLYTEGVNSFVQFQENATIPGNVVKIV